MKQQYRLLAGLCTGLLAHAALADVTVYGVLDSTLESVSARHANQAGKDIGPVSRVSSNSSLIGFKGMEDLGDGLKAIWQVENGVAIDSGNGSFASRDSFVGLSGPAGTVQLGLLTSPARQLPAMWDVNQGATGIGMGGAVAGKLGNRVFADPALKAQSTYSAGAQMQLGPFETRTRNAVQYTSPVWNSLSASAMYAPGETTDVGPKKAYKTEGGLKYDNGTVYGAVVYGRLVTGADDSTAIGKSGFRELSTLRAATFYRFSDQTRIGLLFDRMEGDLTTAGAALYGGSALRQDVWMVNGTLGVTPNGKLLVQYARADKLKGGSDATAALGKGQAFSLGYEYSLSKRTLLKAIYSQILNDGNANYDYGIGSIGNVAAGADPQGFALGLRHMF